MLLQFIQTLYSNPGWGNLEMSAPQPGIIEREGR